MKRILVTVFMLVTVLALNAQSLTTFTIKIDQNILHQGCHVQINLAKTNKATIEYFIDVYGTAETEVAVMGGPQVSYTTRYNGDYYEIIINNFVVTEYGTAGQIYSQDGESLNCAWYFNNTQINWGNYNLYPYGNSSVLTVKLD